MIYCFCLFVWSFPYFPLNNFSLDVCLNDPPPKKGVRNPKLAWPVVFEGMNRITAMHQTSFIPEFPFLFRARQGRVFLIFIRIWLNWTELKWTISEGISWYLKWTGGKETQISLKKSCWICDVHDQQQKGMYTITRWCFFEGILEFSPRSLEK